MLSGRARVATKVVMWWAILAVALQCLVAATGIEYDSNPIWWLSAFVSLPAHFVIEGLSGIGVNLRSLIGYIFVTVLLAGIVVLLLRYFGSTSDGTED